MNFLDRIGRALFNKGITDNPPVNTVHDPVVGDVYLDKSLLDNPFADDHDHIQITAVFGGWVQYRLFGYGDGATKHSMRLSDLQRRYEYRFNHQGSRNTR